MEDSVNHPKHYQPRFEPKTIECIDIAGWLPFCLGNAFKYVWRAGEKGGAEKAKEDLKKALWYLDKAPKFGIRIRLEEQEEIEKVFYVLQDDGSTRFKVLKSIATGYISNAATMFKALETEVMEEFVNGRN